MSTGDFQRTSFANKPSDEQWQSSAKQVLAEIERVRAQNAQIGFALFELELALKGQGQTDVC